METAHTTFHGLGGFPAPRQHVLTAAPPGVLPPRCHRFL